MSSAERLRVFVNERLTAAAEEIFRVFQKTIVVYEEEIARQRKLLDVVWKPELMLHRMELPQQRDCKEEEVVADLWNNNNNNNSNLDSEDREPSQIKEEPCAEEHFEVKHEAEFLIPPYEESDLSDSEPISDHHLLSNDSNVTESRDHKGDKRGESGSTGDAEPEPQSRNQDAYTSNVSQTECNPHTDLRACKKEEEGRLSDRWFLNQESSSSLEKENPEPLQIKEEPEELYTTHEGEQLEMKEEIDSFIFNPPYDETDHSESEPMSDLNSHLAESQDHKAGEHRDSGSPVDAELGPNQQNHSTGSQSTNVNPSEIHHDPVTGKRTYKCDTCGKGFPQSCTLKIHMRIHTGEKPFSCTTCGKDFRSGSALKVHMRSHTGEKPYVCNTCGKRFGYMSGLIGHVRLHTGEKPYSCNFCEKRFSDVSGLKSHLPVHTGEKPHSCKTCGKVFRHGRTLKVHMRIHTGERPYTCETCGRGFTLRGQLKVHMRTHTGEKPYLCSVCGKRYLISSHLAKHIRSHTRDEPCVWQP